ncbi:ABC transporter substrate-binding protein [Ferrovibrio sp.]|uniref:ABC transporter substrate-binding protein n=1 Tax=Ferrovibrio sp. TaxID=1917215 RepID=UPI003D2A26E5
MLKRCLLALSFVLLLGTEAKAQPTVTVYCSLLSEWCELMRASFERDTGIKAQVTTKSTGETFAQIRAEADNPRADVWWGGPTDSHLQAAELGLLQEYKSPTLPKLHPWAQRAAEISGWRSVGIYAGTLGIVWNTDALAKRKLPAPKCWADLLNPAYRDEIQMSSPATSGTSYTVLATLVQIMGEEPAFAYMKKLHVNMNQYPRSGAAPMANVARGESLLGITWMFAAVAEAQLGAPVTSVAPCEGTGYEIGSMSLVKGGKNPDNARKWYEYVLSPAAQATGARAKSFQIPSNVDSPIPPNTPKLEEVKLIDYDFVKYGSAAERRRLLERWEKEVASLPK